MLRPVCLWSVDYRSPRQRHATPQTLEGYTRLDVLTMIDVVSQVLDRATCTS